MKRMIGLSLIFGIVLIGLPVASTAAPCGSRTITGCVGNHRVIVGGSSGSGGSGRGHPISGSKPVTRVISCRSEIEGVIPVGSRTSGDLYVGYCENWAPLCRARAGKKSNPGIVVVLNDGRWIYSGMTCSGNAPPVVTPDMVRARVVRLVPSAAIGLAPRQATLVHIQTIMWVDAPAQRTLAPFTILGQRVVVQLKLDHVDWNFGDGSSATSSSPGKPYDEQHDPCRAVRCPDYFGHTYRTTGNRDLTATAYWRASFTVGGGNAIAIPGTVAGPTDRANLVVKQARAVLVPNP